MTHWSEREGPTPEQQAKAERVHRSLCHEINLMAHEGLTSAELLAGSAAAVADLIKSTIGTEAIAPWFAEQAQVFGDLYRDKP